MCQTKRHVRFDMYHKVEIVLFAAVATLCATAAEYDVAAYVWPAYHPEPRWAELGIFKDGKGEWLSAIYVRTIRCPR